DYTGSELAPAPSGTPYHRGHDDTAEVVDYHNRETVHWYGVDGRFSVPQWVFRSELFQGSIGGGSLSAAYLDLLYHPTALPRWTFLGRVERVRGYEVYRRYTAGARRVLSPGLTLSVNWIEDRASFASVQGLNLQLQRTFQY